MKQTNLKNAVYKASLSFTFKNNIELCILCSLVYKMVEAVVQKNNGELNSAKELAKSYFPLFQNKLEEIKEKYTAYDEMKTIINNSGKSNFLLFSNTLINKIFSAYINRIAIEPFNFKYFSQKMYKIRNCSIPQLKRLNNIHFNTIGPIAQFYTESGIIKTPNSLKIYSATGIKDNPGKEILFSIDGVENERIIGDILGGAISTDFYSATLSGDYIRIITK